MTKLHPLLLRPHDEKDQEDTCQMRAHRWEPEESERCMCMGTLFGTESRAAGATSAVLETKGNRGCPKKFI